jgi:hypothetical protein
MPSDNGTVPPFKFLIDFQAYRFDIRILRKPPVRASPCMEAGTKPAPPKPRRDSWDIAFERDENDTRDWRAA